MAGPSYPDDGRRTSGVRWNRETSLSSVNRSNGFDAFRWDVGDVPASDWDDFYGSGKPAPKAQASRAPSEDERCRGYVRGRSSGD